MKNKVGPLGVNENCSNIELLHRLQNGIIDNLLYSAILHYGTLEFF